MAGERDYLTRHPTCEVCREREAVFVSLSGGRRSMCRPCGESWMRKGHAVFEVLRMDEMEESEMDRMDEVQESLERLKRYEANLYRGEKAAREAMDEKEPETVEEALERMLEREAHEYEKEV